jgi:beta-lactamase superfamily II metal-dependent hydrolase
MVYVDDMKAKYGRMIMCHMIADTTEELLEMADKIGVNRKWIQKQGTGQEHFDICLKKRALAVANGAQEVTWKKLGFITIAKGLKAQIHLAKKSVSIYEYRIKITTTLVGKIGAEMELERCKQELANLENKLNYLLKNDALLINKTHK